MLEKSSRLWSPIIAIVRFRSASRAGRCGVDRGQRFQRFGPSGCFHPARSRSSAGCGTGLEFGVLERGADIVTVQQLLGHSIELREESCLAESDSAKHFQSKRLSHSKMTRRSLREWQPGLHDSATRRCSR